MHDLQLPEINSNDEIRSLTPPSTCLVYLTDDKQSFHVSVRLTKIYEGRRFLPNWRGFQEVNSNDEIPSLTSSSSCLVYLTDDKQSLPFAFDVPTRHWPFASYDCLLDMLFYLPM